MTQISLFENTNKNKSYRAIRHDVVRQRQAKNCHTAHHPDEKTYQVRRVLSEICGWGDLSTLELFAGHGNLTQIYAEYGEVVANEYKISVFNKLEEKVKHCLFVKCNRVDSFNDYHLHIYLKQIYDVVDIDPYGFPSRFFPDIFLLINNGILFLTMPKPYVNILNGITQTHLICYYGSPNPTHDEIVDKICTYGLCHWRKVQLIESIDLKSVWRMAFKVEKVKATEYTGVKNR